MTNADCNNLKVIYKVGARGQLARNKRDAFNKLK